MKAVAARESLTNLTLRINCIRSELESAQNAIPEASLRSHYSGGGSANASLSPKCLFVHMSVVGWGRGLQNEIVMLPMGSSDFD